MDNKIYKDLKSRLDLEIDCMTLTQFPNPAENPHSAGLIITKDTEVSQIPENQLPLAHAMLHMFYGNGKGKGLTEKSIEQLHEKLVPQLKTHTKYDRLDT